MTPETPRREPLRGGSEGLREPTPERQPRPPRKAPPSVGARKLAVEAQAIAREMLRLPVAAFFAVAEFAGVWVLKGWKVVQPLLVAAARAGFRLLRFLERELTPARGVALVALSAAVVLAISQFIDYRGVDIGSDAYAGAGVSKIAPPPQVDQQTAGSAHLWLGIPIALLAAAVTVLAMRRRAGLARLLMPLGLIVVAITLLVDLPKGLDEGDAATAYDQVHAQLLGGFWAQLSAGVVLIAVSLLLARYLKGDSRVRRHSSGNGGPSLLSRARRAVRPATPKVSGSSS
jgi:hypothetical protein